MTEVDTFTATIYCGLKVGQSGNPNLFSHTVSEARDVCQQYCDEVGLCVSVTIVDFIYTKGNETGVAVTLINYPRFPSIPGEIRHKALTLAERLKIKMEQARVSIVFPDKTIMLGDGTVHCN